MDFKKKLEDRIKHHDKDIERLCNVYYQGFIESVRELLDVRTQSKKLNVSFINKWVIFYISKISLQDQVIDLDKKVHISAKCITNSASDLLQARKVQSNIAAVIAQLNLCLPVFTTYSKVQKQISEKR